MPTLPAFIRNAIASATQSNDPSPEDDGRSSRPSSSRSSSSSSRHTSSHNADVVTHFLSTPLQHGHPGHDHDQNSPSTSLSPSPPQAIRPIPPISSQPIVIPPTTLLYTLIHPPPAHSEDTAFFLQCLPDPIGYLHHCTSVITSHLSPHPTTSSSSSNSDSNLSGGESLNPSTATQRPHWRFQHITLHIDRHYPHLAATSSGYMRLSLRWIGDIHTQHQQQSRSLADATKEFKGVILHELVHAIQHDGYGTTPGWLIESIADWVRLRAGLGPNHWRKAGQGKSAEEKGWEDGYDSGARFLDWLVGDGAERTEATGEASSTAASSNPAPMIGSQAQAPFNPIRTGAQPSSTTSSTHPPRPQPTMINPPPASQFAPPPRSPHHPHKPRRGPFPNLVRDIDERLIDRKWDDRWWEEMTGAKLKVLWGEYMAYYRD